MFPFLNRLFTLRIEFPALDGLVSFLKESRADQQRIDALTTQVRAAREVLHTSTTGLAQAVTNQQAS